MNSLIFPNPCKFFQFLFTFLNFRFEILKNEWHFTNFGYVFVKRLLIFLGITLAVSRQIFFKNSIFKILRIYEKIWTYWEKNAFIKYEKETSLVEIISKNFYETSKYFYENFQEQLRIFLQNFNAFRKRNRFFVVSGSEKT